MQHIRLFFFIFLILLALTGAFFIGKSTGKKTVQQSYTMNYDFIKEIAELASLEVHGRSELKIEKQFDPSVTGSIQKYFFENTAFLRIPYVAKYGIDMNNADIIVTPSDTQLTIHLLPVTLLSLELKLSEVQTMSQTGVFVSDDKASYQRMEKQLYNSSRNQLENNKMYITQAQNRIERIITNYYQPTGYKVKVVFDLDKGKKIINSIKD